MILNTSIRNIVLLSITAICIILVFFLPPIAQNLSYHQFADEREALQIPNFYNVLSNIPFVIIGFLGLYSFIKTTKLSADSLAYFTLFTGVIGIGLGSAYYHYNPNNTTLVWDRIPMTITFMSYLCIVINQYINKRAGNLLLIPLSLLGIASVLLWYASELSGEGDLRLYVLVQFYPMIIIPLIIFLYPTSTPVRIEILGVIGLYALAKMMEAKDKEIFSTGLISGHSLKHLFAAAAVLLILLMVKRERMKKVNR